MGKTKCHTIGEGNFSLILREAKRYTAVGAVGYLMDVGLFNLLSVSLRDFDWEYGPLAFKTASTVFAVAMTYILNSRWTFAHRTGRDGGFKRVFLYGVVNAIGLSLILVSLFTSRYILGFDSLLADNISGNIIGVGLAFVFRFIMNRKWVFLA